jgi:hypothetical protein
MIPRTIFAGAKIPLLGSGKVDMVATLALVEELMGLGTEGEETAALAGA